MASLLWSLESFTVSVNDRLKLREALVLDSSAPSTSVEGLFLLGAALGMPPRPNDPAPESSGEGDGLDDDGDVGTPPTAIIGGGGFFGASSLTTKGGALPGGGAGAPGGGAEPIAINGGAPPGGGAGPRFAGADGGLTGVAFHASFSCPTLICGMGTGLGDSSFLSSSGAIPTVATNIGGALPGGAGGVSAISVGAIFTGAL